MNKYRGIWHGKRVDNGEWAEGHLIRPEFNPDVAYIGHLFATDDHDIDVVQVDPATLGECSCVPDKNGKPIFDGDICTVAMSNIADDEYGVVRYDENEAVFIIDFGTYTINFCVNVNGSAVEVIGNIHDNPEWL